MTHRPFVPPTEPMWRLMLRLAAERNFDTLGRSGEERVANLKAMRVDRTLDKWQAMRVIDNLKASPRDVLAVNTLQPGVYQRNGVIYVVKSRRDQLGVYAKKLVEIGGRRLTEADTVVQIEFEYAPGAVNDLRPRDMLTLEEARPLIIRYGKCIFCNTPLRDARSVERGVGPVCLRRYAPPKPPPVVDPEAAGRLDDLLAQLEEVR